jgi:translation initiation factor IF-2
MSENSEKDKKLQVASKGVSGTKELKVRRVHKKKADPEADAAKTIEKRSCG